MEGKYNDDGYMDKYTPSIFPLEFPICFISEPEFEVSKLPFEFPITLGIETFDMLEFPIELGYASDCFPYTFPMLLGGGVEPKMYSSNFVELNNSLEPGTYIVFGTIPKGSYGIYNCFVANTGDMDLSAIKIECIVSEKQIGSEDDTLNSTYFQYESDIGTENWFKREYVLGELLGDYGQTLHPMRIKWVPSPKAKIGLKLWGIMISGNGGVY